MAENDLKTVTNEFQRCAQHVKLWALPVTGVDENACVEVQASGDSGWVRLAGSLSVTIQTGRPEDHANWIPDDVDVDGMFLYSPNGDPIVMQRGHFHDIDSQFIHMTPEGINVSGGASGCIALSCGDSSIVMTPTKITIRAPMVEINP